MKFVNPLFLGALAAALLPILIHLLTRDRIRKVAFSTLRFFAKSSGRILRRKRLQEAILLAMRVIVAALLALVFAQPYIHDPSAEAAMVAEYRTARVVVVDLSLSMSRTQDTPEQSRDLLRKEAAEAFDGLEEGSDAAALITFTDSIVDTIGLSKNLGVPREKARQLEITSGATDLTAAVRKADDLLGKIKAEKKEIVIVSDFQRNGWKTIKDSWKIPANVTLTEKRLPMPKEAGLVVTGYDFPQSVILDGNERHVAVRIANYSAREAADLPVTLFIGGKPVAEVKVTIAPDSSQVARLPCKFEKEGDNAGYVRVGTGTPTPQNTVYLNTRGIPQISVVILNGSPSARKVEDAAYFIQKALMPTDQSPILARSIVADVGSDDDLDRARKTLEGAQVVILADVGRLARGSSPKDLSREAELKKTIENVVDRGGGLLFLPGSRVAPKEFERLFGGLAPCSLRKVHAAPVNAAGEQPGVSLASVKYEHPIFELFARPHHGDFGTPKFFQWWEVGDNQQSKVLARFEDGRPALLERQMGYGKGISMLLTSSTDLLWSDFVRRTIFLPYLHQTVRYLALRSEKPTSFVVGANLDIGDGFKLKDPSGNIHADKTFSPQVAGLYVLMQGDKDVFGFAVNTSSAEADLATITLDQIKETVMSRQNEVGETLSPEAKAAAAAALAAEQERQKIWWYLALAVGLLGVAELTLGNHTLRH